MKANHFQWQERWPYFIIKDASHVSNYCWPWSGNWKRYINYLNELCNTAESKATSSCEWEMFWGMGIYVSLMLAWKYLPGRYKVSHPLSSTSICVTCSTAAWILDLPAHSPHRYGSSCWLFLTPTPPSLSTSTYILSVCPQQFSQTFS